MAPLKKGGKLGILAWWYIVVFIITLDSWYQGILPEGVVTGAKSYGTPQKRKFVQHFANFIEYCDVVFFANIVCYMMPSSFE